MRRVVVTGIGGLCPLGEDWPGIEAALREGRSGVVKIEGWDAYPHLHTRLGAPLPHFERPAHYSRKRTRSMGRLALMAVRASELALDAAGLLGDPLLQLGAMGAAYGSSSGSTEAMMPFAMLAKEKKMDGISATSYLKMMPHTCAANVGLYFGLKGRILPTTTACTSGSLAIGMAYEAIKYGQQDLMLAGGADELTIFEVVVFDVVYATSRNNEQPFATPRPFDAARDGLVIGEGACSLVLEELEHAQARGATIYAEIAGFGTNSDGHHVVQPSAQTMQRAMSLALADAGMAPEDIGYINAHATATTQGDIIESQATAALFGEASPPISSLKGHMGHTLGACGALEAWACIEMMRRGWFAPTLHLQQPDQRCAPLDYIQRQGRTLQVDAVMSNNFAFVGINTSLIFKRWEPS